MTVFPAVRERFPVSLSETPAFREPAVLAALACAGLCVALLGARVIGVISLSEPLHVVTSGWEQESLVALWAHLDDSPVYVSRWEVPYRSAVYNWLFYVVYGSVAEAIRGALELGESWVPTLARLLTLFGVGAGVAVAYASYVTMLRPLDGQTKAVCFSFAVLVAAGPLVGFWGLTVRPDLWGLVLEITGVGLFWRLYGRRPTAAAVTFFAFAYAAWAFKQTSVTAAGAVALFLIAERDWRTFAVLSVPFVGSVAATLALGSLDYVNSVFLFDFTPILSMHHMAVVAANFAVKFVPGLAGIAVLVIALRALGAGAVWRSSAPLRLGVFGCAVWLLFLFPLSAQGGSAENYYFPLSYFLSVVTLSSIAAIAARVRTATVVRVAMTSAWLAQSVAVLLVLGGFTGVVSARFMHERFMDDKACLDTLPRPLFVADLYLSLPWMTPGTPPFVLAYGYDRHRRLGRPFDGGGIGGLIDSGYFAALALAPDTVDVFDGGRLDRYERAARGCSRFSVFERTRGGDDG
jgi:hypothetical protein